jgi:hypothetical protein
MVPRVTTEPASGERRPMLWDAFLALALIGTSTATAALLMGLVVLGAPSLGDPPPPLIAGVAYGGGCLVGVRLLRSWPSSQAHSRSWLVAATMLGCGAVYCAGVLLGPWPDLLSEEIVKAGPTAFYLEAARGFVPWLVGAAVTCGSLRYDPVPGEHLCRS